MITARMKLVIAGLIAVLATGCSRTPETRHPGVAASSPAPNTAAGDWFSDRAEETGLRFVHFNGGSGEFYYPEVMPPGVALFDYDNDGDLDVFVVQGQMLGSKPIESALARPQLPLKGRLFRNDLDNGRLHFTDVTEASGIDQHGYGMGVATGDVDNDGCVDLYLTSLGANQLYRNNCNGTFTDVTTRSGLADPGWSVSAAFVDVDRDGLLDLFVGHYVRYSVAANMRCYSMTGLTDFCPPNVFRAEPSHFFHNNGDGTFTDRTRAAGLSGEYGAALGVATADYNGDGWIDIHVSNDSTPNQLWINQKNGTFANAALLAGTAVSPEGMAKASMGVDAGDFDNDGDEDLFIGELASQGADLYVNDGTGVFTDESAHAGLRLASLPFTTFGAGWLDFDNDGNLDVLAVNGAVTHTVEALAKGERFALQQRKQLFRNLGNGTFADVSARGGAPFAAMDVSRGAAFGDIDNDGDTDVVVGNDSGPVRLLINNEGSRHGWIGLRLVGRKRDMLGARVMVTRSDGRMLWRHARADGSYASANDPRVLVGLADTGSPASIRVTWPDGRSEEFSGVAAGKYTTLEQGRGTVR
jgi:hypothetical protein